MDKIRLDRILSDLKHGDLIDTSLTELECIEIIERNKELEGALRGVYGIIDDSTGVEGYHLNGAIAEWDEFPEVQEAYDVLPPAEDKEEVCEKKTLHNYHCLYCHKTHEVGEMCPKMESKPIKEV